MLGQRAASVGRAHARHARGAERQVLPVARGLGGGPGVAAGVGARARQRLARPHGQGAHACGGAVEGGGPCDWRSLAGRVTPPRWWLRAPRGRSCGTRAAPCRSPRWPTTRTRRCAWPGRRRACCAAGARTASCSATPLLHDDDAMRVCVLAATSHSTRLRPQVVPGVWASLRRQRALAHWRSSRAASLTDLGTLLLLLLFRLLLLLTEEVLPVRMTGAPRRAEAKRWHTPPPSRRKHPLLPVSSRGGALLVVLAALVVGLGALQASASSRLDDCPKQQLLRVRPEDLGVTHVRLLGHVRNGAGIDFWAHALQGRTWRASALPGPALRARRSAATSRAHWRRWSSTPLSSEPRRAALRCAQACRARARRHTQPGWSSPHALLRAGWRGWCRATRTSTASAGWRALTRGWPTSSCQSTCAWGQPRCAAQPGGHSLWVGGTRPAHHQSACTRLTARACAGRTSPTCPASACGRCRARAAPSTGRTQ